MKKLRCHRCDCIVAVLAVGSKIRHNTILYCNKCKEFIDVQNTPPPTDSAIFDDIFSGIFKNGGTK